MSRRENGGVDYGAHVGSARSVWVGSGMERSESCATTIVYQSIALFSKWSRRMMLKTAQRTVSQNWFASRQVEDTHSDTAPMTIRMWSVLTAVVKLSRGRGRVKVSQCASRRNGDVEGEEHGMDKRESREQGRSGLTGCILVSRCRDAQGPVRHGRVSSSQASCSPFA